MAKKENEFGCTLIIDTDDENPQIITGLTKIVFTECVIKGHPKLKPQCKITVENKLNEHNLWMFKIERQVWPNGYLNSAIESILNVLDKERNSVLAVLKRFPKSHLLCFGYFYELNPYFVFNKKLIKRLNDYNIDLEFDVYCLND